MATIPSTHRTLTGSVSSHPNFWRSSANSRSSFALSNCIRRLSLMYGNKIKPTRKDGSSWKIEVVTHRFEEVPSLLCLPFWQGETAMAETTRTCPSHPYGHPHERHRRLLQGKTRYRIFCPTSRWALTSQTKSLKHQHPDKLNDVRTYHRNELHLVELSSSRRPLRSWLEEEMKRVERKGYPSLRTFLWLPLSSAQFHELFLLACWLNTESELHLRV